MSQDLIHCSHCGARYRRGSLVQGAQVVCRKCGQAFLVQDAPGAQDPKPPEESGSEAGAGAAASAPRRSRGAARPGGGKRHTARPRASRQGEPRPARATAGSRVWLVAGCAAALAVVVVLWAALGGGAAANGNAGSDGSPTAEGPADPAVPAPPPLPPPGPERVEHFRARAAQAEDTSARVALLLQAASAAQGPGFEAPDQAERLLAALHEEILALDPDNQTVRRARGEVRYQGLDEEKLGKWVTSEEQRELDREFLARREEERRKSDVERERARWEKDAWTHSARRVADIYEKRMPEGMNLRFLFDRERVQRPYFLMVEDVPIPDPVATGDAMGPGLTALRKAFHERFDHVMPSTLDDDRVVPVMILSSVESYKKYRVGKEHLPTEGLVAAFYVSASESPRDYLGTLYVWQGAPEKQFHEVVFHEATHQLMHNVSIGERMGETPWLQEGIAEYFGAYEGNLQAGYTFGHVLESRKGSVRRATAAYYQTPEEDRESAGGGGYLTPRQLVEFDRTRFLVARAVLEGRIQSAELPPEVAARYMNLIYAQGWALTHFLNSFGGGLYRPAFEDFVGKELRYTATPETFAELLGISSDEDWERLSQEFFLHCHRELR